MLSTFKNLKLKKLGKYGVLLSVALFVCCREAFPNLLMDCNCTPPSETSLNKSFQHNRKLHREFVFFGHETSYIAAKSGHSFLSSLSS